MKLKKIISLFLASLIFMNTITIGAFTTENSGDGLYHGEMQTTTVWNTVNGATTADGEKQTYDLHRIPGVVVTEKGTVIIYCESRTKSGNVKYSKAGGDWNLSDVYIQRSEDRGQSFGEPIYIAEGDNSGGDNSYACINNPVMLVGKNNTLFILYCKDYGINGGSIWMRRSADDGKTWSDERDLGYFGKSATYIDEYDNNNQETWAVHSPTLDYDYNAIAFGPTHGICTSNGTLVVPVWISAVKDSREETSHASADVHLIYSTDNGETWNMQTENLFAPTYNCSETAISELSDGTLFLSARNAHKDKVRVVKTIGATFPNSTSVGGGVLQSDLTDPGCCGGLARVNVVGLPYLTLAVGCDSNTAREFVTVKCSYDNGKTFSNPLIMKGSKAGSGGYCDIYVDDMGKAYVLWEENWGAKVYLTTFSVADEFYPDGGQDKTSDWYANETSTILGDCDEDTLFIDDANDLLAFATELKNGKTYEGKTVTLTHDIDFNAGYTGGIDKPNNVWPDTSVNGGFKGVLNGNKKTISGIYYEPSKGVAGLFGNLKEKASDKVEIKDLAIVNSFIYLSSAQDYCGTLFGIICGDGNVVDISNVYLDVTMRHGNIYALDKGRCGGFVAQVYADVTLNFNSCVFAGDMWLAKNHVPDSTTAVQVWSGGFVGYTSDARTELSFNDCAFYGKLTSTHTGSQFVGIVQTKPTTPYSFVDCVAGGYVSSFSTDRYAFTAARNSYNKFTNCYYNKSYKDGTSNVAVGSVSPSEITEEEINKLEISGWQLDEIGNVPLPSSIATSFKTEVYIANKSWYDENDTDKSFTISTPGQLLGFAELIAEGVDFGGMTVEICDDIAVNTLSVNNDTRFVATSWYPMSYHSSAKDANGNYQHVLVNREFSGTLDGNYHTVSGIYYLADITSGYGILGNVVDSSSTVKNISVVDSTVIANRGNAGGFFGRVSNSIVTFDNVYSDIDLIRTAYARVDDTDNSYGGLIGVATFASELIIKNSIVAGSIDIRVAMAGGFVGVSNATVTISDSAFYGALNGNGNSTGAVVGRINSNGYNTNIKNVIIGGELQSNGDLATVLAGTFSVENSIFTTEEWASTVAGAIGVYNTDITGSAAIATLKDNSFDMVNTWVATVKGMPMPKNVASMIGALAVLDLEENYKSEFFGYQTTAVNNGEFGVRLIAIVDSLDYADAGFKITAVCENSGRNNTTGDEGYSVTKVYESIVAADVTYTVSELSNQDGYIITLVINGFKTTEGTVSFTVQTFADENVSEQTMFSIDTIKVAI